jgi:hypothetical protein
MAFQPMADSTYCHDPIRLLCLVSWIASFVLPHSIPIIKQCTTAFVSHSEFIYYLIVYTDPSFYITEIERAKLLFLKSE